MKLSELLNDRVIIPELKGTTKEEVINELINLFKDDPRVKDIDKVRSAVMEREKIMSTGVGKNFAIPHGKTDAITDILCAFGKASKPVDYQSLDAQPVYLVFLLIGKENLVSMHIKLLSRISRMMTKDNFRQKLINAISTEDIITIFREEESSYYEL
ncbi:MAG TPA: PTS sugar transporter subunit IIA [Ignavibacteriaceae bacterium]|jgi:fructose-specific phosphotransferase system IIA component|nr:PTS sugar transporter subunit IIA [Ignavibacteriaceae bacterium]